MRVCVRQVHKHTEKTPYSVTYCKEGLLSLCLSAPRALEQKKRAMAQAEEERRRRALEERRQTQREATERCKMAISRLRSSSRPLHSHTRDIPVESKHSSKFYFVCTPFSKNLLFCLNLNGACPNGVLGSNSYCHFSAVSFQFTMLMCQHGKQRLIGPQAAERVEEEEEGEKEEEGWCWGGRLN